MKGIILAGGHGSRLHPITIPYSKQLIPIFDKPLIYYPLSTLMNLNITEILIILKANQKNNFETLLGNGNHLGLNIKYAIQENPNGIAESFLIGNKFIDNDSVALILGDNIFYGQDFLKSLKIKEKKIEATIFLYEVKDASQYGVAKIKNNKLISIIEKPSIPISNLAVTGLYIYDNNVVNLVKKLKPSKRHELEITDLNNLYIKKKKLNFIKLDSSAAWFDAGTPSSLLLASQYVQAIQERNNSTISSPEQVALQKKLINKNQFLKLIENKGNNSYYNKLKAFLKK